MVLYIVGTNKGDPTNLGDAFIGILSSNSGQMIALYKISNKKIGAFLLCSNVSTLFRHDRNIIVVTVTHGILFSMPEYHASNFFYIRTLEEYESKTVPLFLVPRGYVYSTKITIQS